MLPHALVAATRAHGENGVSPIRLVISIACSNAAVAPTWTLGVTRAKWPARDDKSVVAKCRILPPLATATASALEPAALARDSHQLGAGA